jgi:spoIIIJ-associated protein
MDEVYTKAQTFIQETVRDFGFQLTVAGETSEEGFLFNLHGHDVQFLLMENGELLDALEHLANQNFGHSLPRGQRFVCDADSFRQTRKAELHAMARFAAENVRKNGRPFVFGKLTAAERRIIHLSLQSETDIKTESIGDGRDRRLQVRLN